MVAKLGDTWAVVFVSAQKRIAIMAMMLGVLMANAESGAAEGSCPVVYGDSCDERIFHVSNPTGHNRGRSDPRDADANTPRGRTAQDTPGSGATQVAVGVGYNEIAILQTEPWPDLASAACLRSGECPSLRLDSRTGEQREQRIRIAASDGASRESASLASSTGFTTARDFGSSSLRGVHIGARVKPLDQRELSPAIRDLGANLVRVQLRLETCSHCDAWHMPGPQIENLDLLLQIARRDGFRVVVNVMPEGKDGSGRSLLWTSDKLKASLVDVWEMLARRYKDDVYVAAYDLVNEPFPPGKPESTAPWDSLAVSLATRIRLIDPNHVIVIEPSPHARPAWFANAKRLPIENVVYSVHMYEPHALTHQGVSKQYPVGPSYPGWIDDRTYVDRSWIRKSLRPVIEFARDAEVPIYVGEFGCTRFAPQQSCWRYLRDLMEIMEELGWSWTYHSFREWHGWDAEINSASPDARRRSTNAPVADLLRQYLMRNSMN